MDGDFVVIQDVVSAIVDDLDLHSEVDDVELIVVVAPVVDVTEQQSCSEHWYFGTHL